MAVIDHDGRYYTKTEVDALLTNLFKEQADTAITLNAISASETTVLDLSTASTRYALRNLELKCVDTGADSVTVRIYKLVNDVLTAVDTFVFNTNNYTNHVTLMDMFGMPQVFGDNLKVTVQSSAGTYAITGQYSYAKTGA